MIVSPEGELVATRRGVTSSSWAEPRVKSLFILGSKIGIETVSILGRDCRALRALTFDKFGEGGNAAEPDIVIRPIPGALAAPIITRRERIFRSGRTRPAHARSSGSATSLRIRSLAGYIIGTLETRFRKRQPIHARARAFLESVGKRQILITYQELANALQILPLHSIHRVTEALEA